MDIIKLILKIILGLFVVIAVLIGGNVGYENYMQHMREASKLTYNTSYQWTSLGTYYPLQRRERSDGAIVYRNVNLAKRYQGIFTKTTYDELSIKVLFETECVPKTSVPYFAGTFETTLVCNNTGDGLVFSAIKNRNEEGNFGMVRGDYGGFSFSFDTFLWDFTEMDKAITLKNAKEVTEDE